MRKSQESLEEGQNVGVHLVAPDVDWRIVLKQTYDK
jgi:hypothetical protein